jgi:hypothetical protein
MGTPQPSLRVMARVQTVEGATAWLESVGLALLFPKANIVLPSLWEQVSGSTERAWAMRDEDGRFVAWTKEMATLWGLKDDLAGLDRACVGHHLARAVALVSPAVLPALVAVRPEPELETAETEVLEAIRDAGRPLTAPELRKMLGRDKKAVGRAISVLHRHLLLTNGRLDENEGASWGAMAHDLLARKWKLPAKLPPREHARRELAELVLAGSGELTAADLSGALGWRRKEAAAVLDEVSVGHDEAGFRVWRRP